MHNDQITDMQFVKAKFAEARSKLSQVVSGKLVRVCCSPFASKFRICVFLLSSAHNYTIYYEDKKYIVDIASKASPSDVLDALSNAIGWKDDNKKDRDYLYIQSRTPGKGPNGRLLASALSTLPNEDVEYDLVLARPTLLKQVGQAAKSKWSEAKIWYKETFGS